MVHQAPNVKFRMHMLLPTSHFYAASDLGEVGSHVAILIEGCGSRSCYMQRA